MLIAIVSGKAAPGATTSTWSLGMGWPRPVLVVDADPVGGDMAPGLLLGRADIDRGLLSWSTAARRLPGEAGADLIGEHVLSVPELPTGWFMPGLHNATQASALTAGGWERLSVALTTLAPGRDVIVDAGRLGESSCWPVIRAADRVVLVCRQSGRSIHAARNAASTLAARLGDLERVALLVVEGFGPYGPSAIARELHTPVLGSISYDPAAAASLSDGAVAGVRGLHRSRLMRSSKAIAGELVAAVPAAVVEHTGSVR